MADNNQDFDVADAPLSAIRKALDSGIITAVELAAECLNRISHYDCRGPSLNAIPLISPDIFAEAAHSDDRRAAGKVAGPLDGIPYTVKDSYQVKGMTVAAGSPAFQDLQSGEDAFLVQKLREAGAVLIGKTNMPPMAYGGMQRGVYGRAENPYNKDYLAAAFASGSSNGSAVSTAASFAAFGLGSETVSSGRSPAANNGLIAYTPSKGLISCRGLWPLYPTCDVPVPHTRSVDDMLELLDVLAQSDAITRTDFWRAQQIVEIPNYYSKDLRSFTDLSTNASIAGLRIAVPSCYIGGPQLEHILPVHVSPEVIALWEQAKADLEAHGAEVVVVNQFPVVQVYENPDCASSLGLLDVPRLPEGWNSVERGALIARTWDLFLREMANPKFSCLRSVDPLRLFPAVPPDHPQIAYAEPTNAIKWAKLKDHLTSPDFKNDEPAMNSEEAWQLLLSTPELDYACRTLEQLRKALFDDWLEANRFDMVVFPAAGDVGRADADVSHSSAKHAWTNGVKYSNGNRAFRHLGIPSVTVPMGIMAEKGVPMGLTFCGPGYSDEKLLSWARAFESLNPRRTQPTLTPSLTRMSAYHKLKTSGPRPALKITDFVVTPAEAGTSDARHVSILLKGSIIIEPDSQATISEPSIEIFIDGQKLASKDIQISKASAVEQDEKPRTQYAFEVKSVAPAPPKLSEHEKTEATVARDQTMVLALAWTLNDHDQTKSRASGWYGLA